MTREASTIATATQQRSARSFTAFECDHLRPVVYLNHGWHHVTNGNVGPECSAPVYQIEATYEGEHYLHLRSSQTHEVSP